MRTGAESPIAELGILADRTFLILAEEASGLGEHSIRSGTLSFQAIVYFFRQITS